MAFQSSYTEDEFFSWQGTQAGFQQKPAFEHVIGMGC